jgi:hypothetical protein
MTTTAGASNVSPELENLWHAREHDQVAVQLRDIQQTLTKMSLTLTEIKTERRVSKVAGSYVIPGLVAVAASYVGRRLGL